MIGGRPSDGISGVSATTARIVATLNVAGDSADVWANREIFQLDEKGRHYLQRVRAGTKRMGDLIDDMLGLAKISRKELTRQRVDLSAIAERVAAELAGRDSGHRLRVVVEAGLTATADSGLVEVLLENLMGNAWKFSSRKDDPTVQVG